MLLLGLENSVKLSGNKKILSDLESPSKLREKSDASEAFKLTLSLIGLCIHKQKNQDNVF
jgi:hypothetical protein